MYRGVTHKNIISSESKTKNHNLICGPLYNFRKERRSIPVPELNECYEQCLKIVLTNYLLYTVTLISLNKLKKINESINN